MEYEDRINALFLNITVNLARTKKKLKVQSKELKSTNYF